MYLQHLLFMIQTDPMGDSHLDNVLSMIDYNKGKVISGLNGEVHRDE